MKIVYKSLYYFLQEHKENRHLRFGILFPTCYKSHIIWVLKFMLGLIRTEHVLAIHHAVD